MNQRWDDDQRGRGVAAAQQSLPDIEQLAQLAGTSDWVAEDPEAHLMPGLRDRVAISGLTLDSFEAQADGTFRVRLGSTTKLSRREIRESVWAILGGVVELSTLVRERSSKDVVRFDVVTGIPPGGHFATHGHTLLIEVAQPS